MTGWGVEGWSRRGAGRPAGVSFPLCGHYPVTGLCFSRRGSPARGIPPPTGDHRMKILLEFARTHPLHSLLMIAVPVGRGRCGGDRDRVAAAAALDARRSARHRRRRPRRIGGPRGLVRRGHAIRRSRADARHPAPAAAGGLRPAGVPGAAGPAGDRIHHRPRGERAAPAPDSRAAQNELELLHRAARGHLRERVLHRDDARHQGLPQRDLGRDVRAADRRLRRHRAGDLLEGHAVRRVHRCGRGARPAAADPGGSQGGPQADQALQVGGGNAHGRLPGREAAQGHGSRRPRGSVARSRHAAHGDARRASRSSRARRSPPCRSPSWCRCCAWASSR